MRQPWFPPLPDYPPPEMATIRTCVQTMVDASGRYSREFEEAFVTLALLLRVETK